MLDFKDKVSICCELVGTSITQLALDLGTSQQNFSKRLERGRFTDEERQEIARAMGCEYYSYFKFPNGTVVGMNIEKPKKRTKIFPK